MSLEVKVIGTTTDLLRPHHACKFAKQISNVGNDHWKQKGTAKNFDTIKADTNYEHSAAVKSSGTF